MPRSPVPPRRAALPAAPDAALAEGLAGLGLSAAAAPAIQAYLAELARWNRAYNLTAVRDAHQMVVRHVLDSLSILAPVEALLAVTGLPARLLDAGSGAGLPGIPLAILRPQWRLTLLDSNGKKARFLRHVQRTLALANVEVAEGRVESWIPAAPYPLIVSRAFASLADFVATTQALLAPDGRWLAMKGKVSADELRALPPDVSVEAVHGLQVPGLGEARNLVVIRRAAGAAPIQ
jgi:16S rRNA (guanine527-N7)-methyltransferase